jgi:hypothetical protein
LFLACALRKRPRAMCSMDEFLSHTAGEAAKSFMEFQHLHAHTCAQIWTAPLQTSVNRSPVLECSERGKFLHRSFNIRSPPAALDALDGARRPPLTGGDGHASEFIGVQTKRCPGRSKGGPPTARGKIVIATWSGWGSPPPSSKSIQPLSSFVLGSMVVHSALKRPLRAPLDPSRARWPQKSRPGDAW